MKELTISRTIQVTQFEPVTFEATFEKGPVLMDGSVRHENNSKFIERAFNWFGLIIKRSGLTDSIPWIVSGKKSAIPVYKVSEKQPTGYVDPNREPTDEELAMIEEGLKDG